MLNPPAEYPFKNIELDNDDLLFGFKKGDRLVVDVSIPPTPGSLVIIQDGDKNFLCRYEVNNGKESIWPPRGYSDEEIVRVVLGSAVELTRKLA